MSVYVIQPIEEELVARAQERISYLVPGSGGTCRGIADVSTFLKVAEISPPFVLVKYGGELAGEPKEIGNPISQRVVVQWMAFIGALSFSAAGEGRLDRIGGYRGIYSIIDNLFEAWEGYVLTSSPTRGTKMRLVSCTSPGVEVSRVTAIQTWECTVQRRAVFPAV